MSEKELEKSTKSSNKNKKQVTPYVNMRDMERDDLLNLPRCNVFISKTERKGNVFYGMEIKLHEKTSLRVSASRFGVNEYELIKIKRKLDDKENNLSLNGIPFRVLQKTNEDTGEIEYSRIEVAITKNLIFGAIMDFNQKELIDSLVESKQIPKFDIIEDKSQHSQDYATEKEKIDNTFY